MPTALITGANRGIGLAFAKALTARGDTVIATARDPESATDLRATGARVERLDAADESSVAALRASLGDEPIDLLVNNAGVFVDRTKTSFADTTVDDLLDTYRINVGGVLLVTQALAPNVERSQGKRIAHISSNFGSIGATREEKDWQGFLGYRSSKAALNMVHVMIARELERVGITCLSLHPGWVQTDMGGSAAPTTPEQSVEGMLRVIDNATLADTGRFMSFDGSELPW